jgi:hypothetical protein
VQANRERWMALAELAAKEQDSDKLAAFVEEIVRLIEEDDRLPAPKTRS